MRKFMIRKARPLTFRFAFAATTLFVAAFAGSLFGADKAAAGQDPRYPWCVEGRDYPLDCGWATYEACQMTAVGVGRCFANPFYAGPAPAPRRAKRVRR